MSGLKAPGLRCEALAGGRGLALKVLQIGRVFQTAPRAAFDLVEMSRESLPCFGRFHGQRKLANELAHLDQHLSLIHI